MKSARVVEVVGIRRAIDGDALIPHAIRSTSGGTILAGTAGNPRAAVDGDLAVYTFQAADMVLTDNNLVKRLGP